MIPKKYPPNLHTPKNIEIQNFEPPKMIRAYVCMKISEYPPPPWGQRSKIWSETSSTSLMGINLTLKKVDKDTHQNLVFSCVSIAQI